MIEERAILSMEDLVLGYGPTVVLNGVNFSMERGDFAALLGPNGAGKTTILRAILGEVKPKAGRLRVAGGTRLGYVPQVDAEGSLWPLRVADFVALFTTRGRQSVGPVLHAVGIPDLARKDLQELSGGERQKVLLAKALANQPDLLLLDEPTQGMDVASEADYLDLLQRLNDDGMSIVLVTHLLHVVLSVAEKVLVVQGGRTAAATVDALLREPILQRIYNRPFDSGRIGSTAVLVPSRSCSD